MPRMVRSEVCGHRLVVAVRERSEREVCSLPHAGGTLRASRGGVVSRPRARSAFRRARDEPADRWTHDACHGRPATRKK